MRSNRRELRVALATTSVLWLLGNEDMRRCEPHRYPTSSLTSKSLLQTFLGY